MPAAKAQKTSPEKDQPEFQCRTDSICELFTSALRRKRVDSLIDVVYDYDDGRLPDGKRIFIWAKKGKTWLRLIQGCDEISRDTTVSIDLRTLWTFIGQTSFAMDSVPIGPEAIRSHDNFYGVIFRMPKKKAQFFVADHQRIPAPGFPHPESDTRVHLVNKLDSLIRRW